MATIDSIEAAPRTTHRYESFILLGDTLCEDADGLVHSVCLPIGVFDDPEQAKRVAHEAAQGTPNAIGCGVRRAQHEGEQLEGAVRRFLPHQVASDYMRPTFEPGDIVEIDSAVKVLPRNQPDGVYLLAFPMGEPALRRLQVNLTTGRVRVFCDRDVGTDEAREEYDESDLEILGRATRVMNVRYV